MGTNQEVGRLTSPTIENTETSIQIKKGKLVVNGEETSNPEQIGYAILDLVEQVAAESTISEARLAFFTVN